MPINNITINKNNFFKVLFLTVVISCEKTTVKNSVVQNSLSDQNGLKTENISSKSSEDSSDLKIQIEHNKSQKLTNWYGNYTCKFLRMKEESGDPRGWGMIYINVEKDNSTFKLESYIEQVSKKLDILTQNKSEITLLLKGKKDSTFIIFKKGNKYFLKSNFIDDTVGENENYLLKKN